MYNSASITDGQLYMYMYACTCICMYIYVEIDCEVHAEHVKCR